jgi:hypothetical protein
MEPLLTEIVGGFSIETELTTFPRQPDAFDPVIV